MQIYYLYYDKDKIIDLKQHINKYNYETSILGIHEPILGKGAPILVNVDGSYVKQSDIPSLFCKSKKNYKEYDEYCWCRDNTGRVIRRRGEK